MSERYRISIEKLTHPSSSWNEVGSPLDEPMLVFQQIQDGLKVEELIRHLNRPPSTGIAVNFAPQAQVDNLVCEVQDLRAEISDTNRRLLALQPRPKKKTAKTAANRKLTKPRKRTKG